MRKSILGLAVLAGGLILYPTDAVAQQGTEIERFVCESEDNRHNECRYRSSGDVTVHVVRQISSTRCTFDENWGTFDGGVWVDYGCRAEFAVRRPPSGRSVRPTGGQLQVAKCESRENRRHECTVSGDLRHVHLERQLSGSQCIRGYSWGTEGGNKIWVDHGCRAEFSFPASGRSYSRYAGTPHDFELPCESIRGAWEHCNVPQIRSARVRRIAGNNECNGYKAWGVDDTGIWVRNNCQGAFRVEYIH